MITGSPGAPGVVGDTGAPGPYRAGLLIFSIL